jgi:hypothetical protein
MTRLFWISNNNTGIPTFVWGSPYQGENDETNQDKELRPTVFNPVYHCMGNFAVEVGENGISHPLGWECLTPCYGPMFVIERMM